jgi:glycerol uptake facilitator-like aquaporin
MDEKLRCYLAELCGTFVLVLFSAGAVCAYYLPTDPRLEVTGVAMASGFTLAVLLTGTFHLSGGGYLNPALTVMLWVFKRMDGTRTLMLISMQLVGAALAGLTLRFLFSDEVLFDAKLGAPHLAKSLLIDGSVTLGSLLTGFAVEMVLTALLTWAVFATLLDPRGPRLGGVGAGLAQTANVVVGFRLTGGAANPAVWFGPAIWQTTLPGWPTVVPPDHAVYWAGPVVGALLGAWLYSALIMPERK